MIIIPVGLTNGHHLPTEFFTAYRMEGENTVFPCTWHEPGIEILGDLGKWSYELMFLPGLDSDRFSTENFIQGGAGSPYEFKIANSYAGAFRIDNHSVKGLRMGLSGYFGSSFNNSLTKNSKYKNCRGEVMIGSADFTYTGRNVIARGCFDYAHLNDSQQITAFNKNNMSNASPSPHNAVGSDAIVGSLEVGYDILSLFKKESKCYPHQTIWPYTDMVQHRLFMKNDIRTGWCRTTPLWGRGLSELVAGGVDRLHDCRARTVIEAIMWHGSAQSDARESVENFRTLSKTERDAVVKFINSI